jgi:hypothetical protein
MENGFFSYENQAETMRVRIEALKNEGEGVLSMAMGMRNDEGTFGRLFNVKLLPGYDRIAKYFGIAVVSAGTTADGFVMKAVMPTPAGLRK